MEVEIRELYGPDFARGFLDALAHLTDVNLTVDQAKELFRVRLGAGIRTYVAMVADRCIGTASLIIEQKFIHSGGRVGHVEDVAVHPDYVGHGVGGALIRYITEQAKKYGCYKIILDCLEDRVPFYERHGYRRVSAGMRLDLH